MSAPTTFTYDGGPVIRPVEIDRLGYVPNLMYDPGSHPADSAEPPADEPAVIIKFLVRTDDQT